jgi:cyclophilin family peptidyl-prolyl cis-trans isomerase
MLLKRVPIAIVIILLFLVRCKESSSKEKVTSQPLKEEETAISSEPKIEESKASEEEFKLTEDNAIQFFFDYQQDLKVDKVKLTTSMGSFTIQLYDNVPYHKANFIFLTREGYFNGTQFHRVVKDFIIQGGNADDKATADRRRKIGRYLLPPDTRKGYKHDRGTISMPSSESDNPHKLASPYEFFIVVTKPGSYHLDGDFTPFGRVIQGMDIVDKINKVKVGKGDWPSKNVYIEKAEVIE